MVENPTHCPHCNYLLDDGDIYERMLEMLMDEGAAARVAESYGWSKENPLRFSKIMGIYSWEYDRITHHECPECRERINLAS